MARLCLLVAFLFSMADVAQADSARRNDDLAPLLEELLIAIETLSDYRAPERLPPVFELPQHVLEAKVCEEPCTVMAACVPGEGIYLAAHLDPVREPSDRAALLHELVHALQQGHSKFAALAPCEREHAKETEAYALQNAYLGMIGSSERVVFYDGEFDCVQNEDSGSSWPASLTHTPRQGETLLKAARDLLPHEELPGPGLLTPSPPQPSP